MALLAHAGAGSPFSVGAVAVLVAVVAVYVLVLGGVLLVVRWRRRHGSTMFARSPLWALPYRERVALVRALRRGDPIPAGQWVIAAAAARSVAGGRWAVVGLGVGAVAQGFAAWLTPGDRWLRAGSAALLVVAAAWSWWQARRIGARLPDLERQSAGDGGGESP